MSMDTKQHDDPPVATPSQTVGPFFHFGLKNAAGTAEGSAPERITIAVRVLDGDGAPVGDAMVEFWSLAPGSRIAESGRVATGVDGGCSVEVVQPQSHVNLCIFARGLLHHVFTRIYFAGDEALDRDPVLALVATGRRHTLIAQPDGSGRWLFDIRLQGPDETAFFTQ